MRASRTCARAGSIFSSERNQRPAPCRCLRPPPREPKSKTPPDRTGLTIARIETHRLLKLRTRPLRQAICRDKRCAVRLLAQCPSQPQMIVRVLAVEPHCLFALVRRIVPALQREVNPAAQIMRFGRRRQANSKAKAPGPPRPTAVQHSACASPLFGTSAAPSSSKSAPATSIASTLLHRTLCDRDALLQGLLLSWFLWRPSHRSFSPERMATCVRLIAPVTTNVFFNSSPSIL